VIISSLRTSSFRNLENAAVDTAAGNIFLVGENGQGKTNFLEALYFCSYASSFRGARDAEIAKIGTKNFSAAITVNSSIQNIYSEVLIKFEKGKKKVFLDNKPTIDRKELLSVIPCIVFCHEDMEFVAGNHERRRWFFDQVLSLYDPVYLDDFRRYRRALKTRNSVLRDIASHRLDGSPGPLMDSLDEQCAHYGVSLMEKRETAGRLFTGVFMRLYAEVGGVPGMSVLYTPSWKNVNDHASAAALLHNRRDADMAAGISLSGPHRDRYMFAVDGVEFTGNASTGQRRLLALLLRVAQACRFSETTGRNPILLFDDVLLEIDGEKRRRFLAALPVRDQAFFTFLPEEPYQLYNASGGDTLVYNVKQGRVTAL
jgi:DNA replication and repair protein RecF